MQPWAIVHPVGELVMVHFADDNIELVMYRAEARKLADALTRASFMRGGDSECLDASDPLEVDTHKRPDASA